MVEAPAAAVAGEPDAAAIRRQWSTVLDKVRERSRSLAVMLAGAVVRTVDGGTLVLNHESAPLAKRLNEQRNAEVVEEALKDALGMAWKVRYEFGTAEAGAPSAPATAEVNEVQRKEEDSMLAEAGNDKSETPRRDPEEAALELLQNELGARPIDGRLARPPRPQRQSAVIAVVVELDREHLVKLHDIGLEAHPRAGHVEAPHLGGGQPDLFDRLVPVLDEVARTSRAALARSGCAGSPRARPQGRRPAPR